MGMGHTLASFDHTNCERKLGSCRYRFQLENQENRVGGPGPHAYWFGLNVKVKRGQNGWGMNLEEVKSMVCGEGWVF